MLSIRFCLLALLAIVTAFFAWRWGKDMVKDARKTPDSTGQPVRRPTIPELLIGFVTNFFDTLGIGSYAPTTSFFKLFKIVPDEYIPGTLNVGHTVPTFLEAVIFITIVEIEMKTLALMILASVLGAWLGAGIVASWERRKIQIGMGIALLAAAIFFLMKNLGLFPSGSDALGLSGVFLVVGLVGNFILGALMTLGIGAYAPCMILTSLLGMNPRAAFPIIMGSCAFLMPTANVRFIAKKRYSPGPSLGLAIGGAPAVIIAAYLVKSLPLTAIRWLVILVVTYTAAAMLRSAKTELPAIKE
ncbi:MAG: sulfite exporter TauE/SafE family protein [Elusimicrobia bacterium]|nr:sulfite exporter TauE/SafE family protein [Elusimicrobiota bacterium]